MSKDEQVPPEYYGREHMLVKHTVLRRYFMRLAMIVGQWADTIGFVDCFAGPWKSKRGDLSDTAIGIAIEQLKKAYDGFEDRDGFVTPEFKGVFVEKDDERFSHLSSHLSKSEAQLPRQISLNPIQGNFQDSIDDILGHFGKNDFVFFFIDPKGWSDVEPRACMTIDSGICAA
jgi:three-Cys-motif partner protein